jgi:hypothetical protein
MKLRDRFKKHSQIFYYLTLSNLDSENEIIFY